MVDCEPDGVVDVVCDDGVAVVAEVGLDEDCVESMVLLFVREPVE